jgi:hypothetical protein
MKRIRSQQPPMRPDGCPMTDDDFRELYSQITKFDKIEFVEEGTREFIERFMPDLVDRLPARKMRGAAVRKTSTRRAKPRR